MGRQTRACCRPLRQGLEAATGGGRPRRRIQAREPPFPSPIKVATGIKSLCSFLGVSPFETGAKWTVGIGRREKKVKTKLFDQDLIDGSKVRSSVHRRVRRFMYQLENDKCACSRCMERPLLYLVPAEDRCMRLPEEGWGHEEEASEDTAKTTTKALSINNFLTWSCMDKYIHTYFFAVWRHPFSRTNRSSKEGKFSQQYQFAKSFRTFDGKEQRRG